MSAPTPALPWRAGLNAATSLGSQGCYRNFARHDQVRVGSLFYRESAFYRLTPKLEPALALALPSKYSVEHGDHTWTGRTLTYTWENGGCTANLRSTLPGPRFTAHGNELRLRWLGGCEPQKTESLTDAATWTCAGVPDLGGRRLLLTRSKAGLFLLVLAGFKTIEITSHAHWVLRADAPRAHLLVVRLLSDADIPRDAARQAAWLALLDTPPLECSEEYAVEPGRLHLRHRFAGSAWSPLPPAWAALGAQGNLFTPPANTLRLLDLPAGPYVLAPGDSWLGSIATAWLDARLVPAQPGVTVPATELPAELAYPGDNTWRPETDVLDRVMMLRLWANYWPVLAPETREQLRPWINPPTAEAYRASLLHIKDPYRRVRWAKDKLLFEENGDVSYDPDWYNGLTLSGFARGAACADPAISTASRALAAELRPERDELVAYFSLYADWALGSAWTDPRGLFINTNCLQNGLEGLVAERRLRLLENDSAGADEMTLLAARSGLSYLAFHAQVAHVRRVGWANSDNGGPHFGANFLFDDGGVVPLTAETKNLYYLPSHFPETAALLRAHGDLDALRAIIAKWDEPAETARRRAEWLAYYLAEDPRSFTYECERREQGALTFLTAPELIARIWILGQDPQTATAPYQRPLRLPDPAVAVMRLA